MESKRMNASSCIKSNSIPLTGSEDYVNLHKLRQFLSLQVFQSLRLEDQSNLSTATKTVTAWVRVYLKGTFICGGAENVLLRLRVIR